MNKGVQFAQDRVQIAKQGQHRRRRDGRGVGDRVGRSRGQKAARQGVVVVLTGLVLLALASPVGANTIPDIDIGCDSVAFSWIDFPARPVDLTVTLEQHGRTYERVVSTDGERDGETVIPANFADGPASATVTWHLQKDHSVGPVEAVLHCTETPPPAPTTTAEPTTTSVSVGSPVSITPTTVVSDCGPDTLACTGSSQSTTALAVFGGALVGVGGGLAVSRRRGTR